VTNTVLLARKRERAMQILSRSRQAEIAPPEWVRFLFNGPKPRTSRRRFKAKK
jgi:hypothetical protein